MSPPLKGIYVFLKNTQFLRNYIKYDRPYFETKIKSANPSIDSNIDGGALLYIKVECYHSLPNLDQIMYKPKHLESVFIEICNFNNNKNL